MLKDKREMMEMSNTGLKSLRASQAERASVDLSVLPPLCPSLPVSRCFSLLLFLSFSLHFSWVSESSVPRVRE